MRNDDSTLELMQEIFKDENCTRENLDEFLRRLAIKDVTYTESHFAPVSHTQRKQGGAYGPEKITPNPDLEDLQSEPYLTFEKMRWLGRDKADIWYFTNYYINEPKLFLEQAQFMKDFTDSYSPIIPFDTSYATYNCMTNSQLRTYFTWRTKVRQGIIENVPLSYVFCYVYELLNGVGVKNAVEGMEKLIALWTFFKRYTDRLDNSMRIWIRDYYVEHKMQLPIEFSQYINQFPVPYYNFDMELLKKVKACTWDDLYIIEKSSSFKITNGQFYKMSNQEMIEKCACFTIQRLAKVFKNSGLDLQNLFFENRRHKILLYLNAVHPEVVIPFPIAVELNAFETIQGDNRGWHRTYVDLKIYRPIIGYILKLVEIKMRQHFGFKKNLQAPTILSVEKSFLKSEPMTYLSFKPTMSKLKPWKRKAFAIISSPRFEEAITCAISDYCKTEHIVSQNGIIKVLKPIEIDMSKIKDIERDHMETVKKLIVTESPTAAKKLAKERFEVPNAVPISGSDFASVPNAVPFSGSDSVSVPNAVPFSESDCTSVPNAVPFSGSDSVSVPNAVPFSGSDSVSVPNAVPFSGSDSVSIPDAVPISATASNSDSIPAPIFASVSAPASDSISVPNLAPTIPRIEMMGTEVLIASLSAESKALLRVILEGQAPPNSELLIDTINEKALEAISDNLIDYAEGVPYVYDNYIDELKLSLGGK